MLHIIKVNKAELDWLKAQFLDVMYFTNVTAMDEHGRDHVAYLTRPEESALFLLQWNRRPAPYESQHS